MSMIQISHLSFTYDGSSEPVFDDLSLTLDTSWRLGLVGRNGRGKTTLLRLLSGELHGSGLLRLPVPCRRFPVPVPDHSRTVQAVMQALCPDAMDWQIACEAGQLGLSEAMLARPFGTLSGGEQTRALLAALFLSEDRFLLIDEPTNHLDAQARALTADYLRRKQGFLLVSHDRAFLDACIDHILVLGRSEIELQAGHFSSWWENRQRKDACERAQNRKLLHEIDRLSAAAQKAEAHSRTIESAKFGGKTAIGLRPDRGAIGHKSAKMMKRAKHIEARTREAANQKASLLQNVERVDALHLTPLHPPAPRLAEVRGNIPCGGRILCPDVRLEIRPGDRIALTGSNGCGKSTLLRLLAGQAPAEQQPHVRRTSGLKVSYVPQGTHDLSGSLLQYAQSYAIDPTRFLTLLRKLGFSRALFEQPIACYSEGQKKKVMLARSLCESAHLYLWGEPLNYIDVFSRMQLEELLRDTGATIVFVEHDQAFVSRTATQVIALP